MVRSNAKWLDILAFPIMFLLNVESDLVIGLIYPAEYLRCGLDAEVSRLDDTAFVSKTILFFYVMMVAGGAKTLLLFTVVVTLMNLGLNFMLVGPLGLTGGCLVIIFTKLVMALLTFLYCQVRFRFFSDYGCSVSADFGRYFFGIVFCRQDHCRASSSGGLDGCVLFTGSLEGRGEIPWATSGERRRRSLTNELEKKPSMQCG